MRPRRDFPSRPEEKSNHGRGNNPPSRHLWVGNLSHSLTESAVARQFAHFGDLDSIAFNPGRSYAFINFINEEDAFVAIRELQGYSLAGNPIRIEFAKAEKSSIPLHDQPYPKTRESPLAYDSRARHTSPERSYTNKSKMNGKDNEEPSEVLWIGFPVQLKVDEFVLRKAFSPFGEIEKITSFPGRTYAFVRFRTVISAYRAKETLQGKLLGNPHVRICFARNDSGSSGRDRDSRNAPESPRFSSYDRYDSYENFHSERSINYSSRDHGTRSPPYQDSRDFHEMSMIKNADLLPRRSVDHDSRRFSGQGSEMGLQRNVYEPPDSPRNMHSHGRIREYSPQYHRPGPIYDDPWTLPEDIPLLHETKKHKANSFYAENELPEYPFTDFEKEKHIIHPSGIQNYNTRHSGYILNTSQSLREKNNHWNATSSEDFPGSSTPLVYPDTIRTTPDLHGSSSKEVWKWEGLIAKGGTPICRSRCFPVGKPPDICLPEYIDCTAKTSLDMLAKHYYQASSSWVIFFVPANDPDIVYYNEFMNYLGEKQRAAVAKLDERTTLFLVPPSEFSQKVLKVPGKLSISGAVLRVDSPPGTSSIPGQIPSLSSLNDRTCQSIGAVHFPNQIYGQETNVASYNTLVSLNEQQRQQHSNASLDNIVQFGQSLNIEQNNPMMPTEALSDNNQSQFGSQMNQTNSGREDEDADPEKRLQAMLKLAASLLQQIQQGKGN